MRFSFGCHVVIAQVIAAASMRYDIAWPAIVYKVLEVG